MILNAEVNNDGMLDVRIPRSLWGKKVVVSISEKAEDMSEARPLKQQENIAGWRDKMNVRIELLAPPEDIITARFQEYIDQGEL
ncbi:MAG: hypothetical protein GY749_36085 [Desulfobacteraceae bacterium]|nr:hypothetical protein [Desulfobacteraceae bacterium]